MDVKEKKMHFFLAVKDIVELFAEQELGVAYDINVPAVLAYVDSFEFAAHAIECNSKEAIYQLITDDILNGFPVWRLLLCSDWTMNIMERELNRQVQREKEERERKYKCYTCKYFQLDETSIGTFMDCKFLEMHAEETGRRFLGWRSRDRDFKPKTKCKNYEKLS